MDLKKSWRFENKWKIVFKNYSSDIISEISSRILYYQSIINNLIYGLDKQTKTDV